MNRVFESFCRVALEDKLGVIVEEQKILGYLLPPRSKKQKPDLVWQTETQSWIGDAKWKLLSGPISSDEEDDEADESAVGPSTPDLRSRVLSRLSTADVRQLTTYAELLAKSTKRDERAQLAVFYPAPAGSGTLQSFAMDTWNNTRIHLIPVSVAQWNSPRDALSQYSTLNSSTVERVV